MKLLLDRANFYHYTDLESGQRYFSRSQVLDLLDPHAFEDVEADALEAAQYRGRRVHHLFSVLLGIKAGIVERVLSYPEELAGYVESLRMWIDQHHIRPQLIEHPDVDPIYPIAGTPDSKVLYGLQRLPTIVELKTGKVRRRAHRVQVQMGHRFPSYADCKQMIVLYAQKDGTPAIEEIVQRNPADEAWAMNAVNVLIGRTHE